MVDDLEPPRPLHGALFRVRQGVSLLRLSERGLIVAVVGAIVLAGLIMANRYVLHVSFGRDATVDLTPPPQKAEAISRSSENR